MGWRLELEDGGQIALSKAEGPRVRLTASGRTTAGGNADVVLVFNVRELAQLVAQAGHRADPLRYLQAGDQVEVIADGGLWVPAKFLRWDADGLAALVDMGEGYDPAHGNQAAVGRSNVRVP